MSGLKRATKNMGNFLWSKIGTHFSEQTCEKSAKNVRERKLKKERVAGLPNNNTHTHNTAASKVTVGLHDHVSCGMCMCIYKLHVANRQVVYKSF